MKNFVVLGLISIFILTGCQNAPTAPLSSEETIEENIDSPEGANKAQIVASFYPLAYMAEQIVGENADVINIAWVTDPHGYRPSPQDIVKLDEADLVIYQWAEYEPWANDYIPLLILKGVEINEVTRDLELAKMEEHDEHDDHSEEGHEEEHDHEDDHSDHEDHDGHNHWEFDPHTWLDPILAQDMIIEITTSLEKVDPKNADLYEQNSINLRKRFSQLDRKYRDTLSACKNDGVIVSHNAYGYLARRYGVTIYPIAGLSTSDIPSAKVLAELSDKANKWITHILIEDNSVAGFAEMLVRETWLLSLPINPLSRGTLDADKDFFDIMEQNLTSFATSLDC